MRNISLKMFQPILAFALVFTMLLTVAPSIVVNAYTDQDTMTHIEIDFSDFREGQEVHIYAESSNALERNARVRVVTLTLNSLGPHAFEIHMQNHTSTETYTLGLMYSVVQHQATTAPPPKTIIHVLHPSASERRTLFYLNWSNVILDAVGVDSRGNAISPARLGLVNTERPRIMP